MSRAKLRLVRAATLSLVPPSQSDSVDVTARRVWPLAEGQTHFTAATTLGISFMPGSANRCPHCGADAFAVGRVTAECMDCGHPLAIAPTRTRPINPIKGGN